MVQLCGSATGEPSELLYILQHTKTFARSTRKQSHNEKTKGTEFGMLRAGYLIFFGSLLAAPFGAECFQWIGFSPGKFPPSRL